MTKPKKRKEKRKERKKERKESILPSGNVLLLTAVQTAIVESCLSHSMCENVEN